MSGMLNPETSPWIDQHVQALVDGKVKTTREAQRLLGVPQSDEFNIAGNLYWSALERIAKLQKGRP